MHKSRLNVVESVCYQQPGIKPVHLDPGYGLWSESDEQPWLRHTRGSGEWTRLETGWVEHPCLLLLVNTEREGGIAMEVSSSPDGPADWTVYPGESHRGRPSRPVYVRGLARYTVAAFPS